MPSLLRRRTLPLVTVAACSLGCRPSEPAPGHDTSAARVAATRVAPPACGVDARTPLTGEGIGELRVGVPVDELRRTCRVLRDTTALGAEGMPERTMLVDLGRDSVIAVVDSGRVWRLHVHRPAFRTADSLGVGTPVSALQRPGAKVVTGEGAVFVVVPTHCGLSFRLRDAFPSRGSSVSQIADSVVVDEVLAFGCGARRPAPTS